MRILSSIAVLALLGGCSLLQPQPLPVPEPIIKTVTEYKSLEIYQPPLPKAIDLQDVEFFVVTEKNFDEQVSKLEKLQDGTYVLFGLTPQDYENMAYNLQELRRYIRQQKEIIIYYRQATQDDEDTDSEDWLERNEDTIEEQQSK
tara:strand:+ start:850 stop:1284 length:435 start_codon:yes stop_codon:yes gene_type:complete